MLPEAGSGVAHSPGVLQANDPVECFCHVGATAALSRVATVAWPSCLGAGAVARGAGGTDRAKAAEVLSGRCCSLAFAASRPRKGCDRHRQGVTDADRSLHEQGGFGWTTASSIRGDGGAGSTMSRRRPLIDCCFGGGFLGKKLLRCTIGTGTSYRVLRRVQHVIWSRKLEIKCDGDVKIKPR